VLVPVAQSSGLDPVVDRLDEAQLLIEREVPREFAAPVGDGPERARSFVAGLRADLDDPELVGFGPDGPLEVGSNRRVLGEEPVPVVVAVDFDGLVQSRDRRPDTLSPLSSLSHSC